MPSRLVIGTSSPRSACHRYVDGPPSSARISPAAPWPGSRPGRRSPTRVLDRQHQQVLLVRQGEQLIAVGRVSFEHVRRVVAVGVRDEPVGRGVQRRAALRVVRRDRGTRVAPRERPQGDRPVVGSRAGDRTVRAAAGGCEQSPVGLDRERQPGAGLVLLEEREVDDGEQVAPAGRPAPVRWGSGGSADWPRREVAPASAAIPGSRSPIACSMRIRRRSTRCRYTWLPSLSDSRDSVAPSTVAMVVQAASPGTVGDRGGVIAPAAGQPGDH